MYKKVATDLKFVEREKEIEKFWKENKIFEKSLESRKDSETFMFFDGPPTANGKPHIGHVLTRVIKDMIPRYRTMKNYNVPRKAGWDTHGLPVELEVEKSLGINGKEQIEEYGIEPFIKKSKESVFKYKEMWEDFSSVVGFWADMENPYVTYHDEFIESEWWALKQIWEKGLLYKGFKIAPYCPRCGTPLSSHEVAQGYKDVTEKSAVVRFKIKNEDAYFLAWTTTPWTLPSNVALCVNPDEEYVRVEHKSYTYIMAKALVETVLKEDFKILESFTGKDLEYKEYEPLFDFVKTDKKAFIVTCDTYVTLSDGTGIVHIAPAFGEDDSRVGKNYDLPFVQLVNAKGEMSDETSYKGIFVKDADELILADLEKEDKLFEAPTFTHTYPHCWRCNTPLIYYARESWYIKMTEVKDRMIANNNKINWIPESIGKGRFGDWLLNIQDWAISRNRYWGTPLNIWECDSCKKFHSIGSIKELKEKSLKNIEKIELHRPYVDEVKIKCPHCEEGIMKRVPEVIDAWFDSGSMPFAQHHYPFENQDIFKKQFPAEFISEGVDQTRGWFYSLLAVSTLVFDEAPYKNVLVLGHVQDENGQKMSKSKGNAIDPIEALSEYGADAIRWYFYVNSAPWLPNRFHGKVVTEGQRKFMGTLWNTYAFYVLYADIDKFNPNDYKLEYEKLSVMDKWLLSKLNSLIKEVDNNLFNYRITEAARLLQNFVDDLSNWYVRRSRERYWAKGMEQDKINAYMSLYTALDSLTKLAAPFIPFMSEQIYQNIVRSVNKDAKESIHLCDYPSFNEEYIDLELEKNMDSVLNVVVLGRAARNTANIKNRQPIANMYIKSENVLDELYIDIIKEELNLKNVEFKEEVKEFVSYLFKPQLKTVGPKYGKLLNKIREKLLNIDSKEAMRSLEEENVLSFEIDGEKVDLLREDLLIETTKSADYISEENSKFTVVLDIRLSEDLLEEGFIRELVSKVQTMRKEAGFEVVDHIELFVSNNDKLINIIKKNETIFKDEILCDKITYNFIDGYAKDWNLNLEDISLGVKKI